jgi:hypothetical protein
VSRFRDLTVVVSLGLTVALTGCQKPTDQSSAPDSSPSSSSRGAVSSAKSAIREALAPKPLVVPTDTMIAVVLDESLSSKTASAGQNFSATISSPVEIEGKAAIPKGSRVTGIVRDAKSAGRFKGGAVLSLALSSITINGTNYDVQTSNHTLTSKGKGKRTATMIGGGGAAGALIGGLAGGGKGAAIGAAVGAGAGTGGAAFTGNREITLPAETPISFKLLQPVEIKQ